MIRSAVSSFRLGAVALIVVLSQGALGQVSDDFEGYKAGEFPGGVWVDVATRIDEPTTPLPTALVVETVGPSGEPTLAVQQIDAIGTSGGILAEIPHADRHFMSMDFRIDQFSDAQGTAWPVAIGYFQDAGGTDLNNDPQALIYTWIRSRRFRLFVKNGNLPNSPALDVQLSSYIPVVGKWYRAQIFADTRSGTFRATVTDLETDTLVGSTTQVFQAWDPEFGRYDAATFLDGEYSSSGGTHGGLTTVDNAVYMSLQECTGKERLRKIKCRGERKLVVRTQGSHSGEPVRVTLTGGATQDQLADENGAARFRFRHVADASEATAEWACGERQSREVACR